MKPWRQRTFPVSGRRRAPTPVDLLTVVLLLTATIAITMLRPSSGRATEALVQCADGDRSVRLDVDQVVTCDGPLGRTVLRVQDGRIGIEQAPCRLQLCRRMGSTDDPTHSLVCIPNRVQVRVLADPGHEGSVDARSR